MKTLLTATLLLVSLLTSTTQAAENRKMSIIDITGKTYDVTTIKNGLKIKELEGKIVLVEFFGYRCPPCKESIPHLIDLQKKYKDKLAIVAIEVQGYPKPQLKKFVKEKGINYITATEEDASEFVGYIQQGTQWQNYIPFSVVFDVNGVYQDHKEGGLISESTLQTLFKK